MKIFFKLVFLNLILFPFIILNANSEKSGQELIDTNGNKLYYSVKQKKYISCENFNLEGSTIDPELVFGLIGGRPVCDDKLKFEGVESSAKKNKSEPKNIIGIKLFCSFSNNNPTSNFGIEFKNKNKAKLIAINEDEEEIFTIIGKFKALSDRIKIDYKRPDGDDKEMIIDRKTLNIKYASKNSCEVLKKNISIEKKLRNILDEFISEKSSENKI
tara:strand:- start:916 stop:1560 length:645 start_codon:yes stop_codon:yes gene_type:complete